LEEVSESRPRYPPNDPRYNPTKEEAIEMKKQYMIEQMEGYSKVRYNTLTWTLREKKINELKTNHQLLSF
jgi:hypothetical protein